MLLKKSPRDEYYEPVEVVLEWSRYTCAWVALDILSFLGRNVQSHVRAHYLHIIFLIPRTVVVSHLVHFSRTDGP